jgi:hypothetical protein
MKNEKCDCKKFCGRCKFRCGDIVRVKKTGKEFKVYDVAFFGNDNFPVRTVYIGYFLRRSFYSYQLTLVKRGNNW